MLKGDVRAKVICGEINGVRGSVGDVVIDPSYLDLVRPHRHEYPG
ncbi:hypothetical protein [Geobacter metallireducens]|nr:hypothetical protein [Geobacter metallireducens]